MTSIDLAEINVNISTQNTGFSANRRQNRGQIGGTMKSKEKKKITKRVHTRHEILCPIVAPIRKRLHYFMHICAYTHLTNYRLYDFLHDYSANYVYFISILLD